MLRHMLLIRTWSRVDVFPGQAVYAVADEVRQVPFGQPVLQGVWQQALLLGGVVQVTCGYARDLPSLCVLSGLLRQSLLGFQLRAVPANEIITRVCAAPLQSRDLPAPSKSPPSAALQAARGGPRPIGSYKIQS